MYPHHPLPTLTAPLTVFVLPGSFEPLCEMAYKVEEEVPIGNADDLVTDFDKEREPFRRLQAKTFRNAGTELL